MATADRPAAHTSTPQTSLATRSTAVRAPTREQTGVRDLQRTTEDLNHFVYQYGEQYDSYLATEPGRQHFWSTGEKGLISFAQCGRHVLVSGGLIAPQEHKLQLLQEFLDHTDSLRLRPAFYCINESDLPIFREVGYRITKLGEDAIVELGECTFSGKKYEWVRRQANYCKRNGLEASEAGPGRQTPEEWAATLAEVLEICQDSLADKPQSKELEFFDGRIGEHELGLRRLFIARNSEKGGRIEGFVVCNPLKGGRAWSTEIYRHRSDGVRGTVPFLFHHLILQMQEEGVEEVNLCIVPGRNSQTPLPGDNPIVRRGLQMAENWFQVVFDLSGVDHFKSRFRPRYASSYLCAPPKPALGAFVAFVRTFGVFRLDWGKTRRMLWNKLRGKSAKTSTDDV